MPLVKLSISYCSIFSLSVLCDSFAADTQVEVQWILQQMNCMEDMMNLQTQVNELYGGYDEPTDSGK